MIFQASKYYDFTGKDGNQVRGYKVLAVDKPGENDYKLHFEVMTFSVEQYKKFAIDKLITEGKNVEIWYNRYGRPEKVVEV